MAKRFDPSLLPHSPDLLYEEKLWKAGIERIAGIDEAGRGALAGPVAAAAVILPSQTTIRDSLVGLQDSKQLSPMERSSWAGLLKNEPFVSGIGFASHEEIDLLGIIPATRLAAQRAIADLKSSPQHLLLDYLFLADCDIPQTSLVKGDARSLSIAAASVLAKTTRDEMLIKLDHAYPGYHFSSHKGYGTQKHIHALNELGPSPVHRRTFAPLKDRA